LRAEVKLAQKRLADTAVRAPFDGAVSQKLVSVGQFVKDNTPVITVVKTNPLRLRADIPETAAGAVRVGTALTFTTDAAPGVEFAAVVRELNPSLDPKSRSLMVEARMAHGDARLRPGMFVQVKLVTLKNVEVVVVPKQAVFTVAGLSKVYLVRDGKVEERRITPGREIDGWVEVSQDQLNAGDRVATTGFGQLFNGAPVRAS
jgi:RND family efflux transporter MFP subunit